MRTTSSHLIGVIGVRLLMSIILVINVVLLYVDDSSAQAQPQSQAAQIFRIQRTGTTRFIDFDNFMREHPSGCYVTVRAHINEAGMVTSADILEENSRSGPDTLWQEMADVISSWAFSPNALAGSGYIDYTIFVPSRTQGGIPFVEINAGHLPLNVRAGWAFPFGERENLLSQDGLDRGDIMITKEPPDTMPPERTGVMGAIQKIIANLHLPFQLAFGFIFIVLIVTICKVGYGGMKRWAPRTNPKCYEDFCSTEACEIREKWEKAIEYSQLPESASSLFDDKQIQSFKDFQTELTGAVKDNSMDGKTVFAMAEEKGLVNVFFRAEEFMTPVARAAIDIESAKKKVLEAIDSAMKAGKLGVQEIGNLTKRIDEASDIGEIEDIAKEVDPNLPPLSHVQTVQDFQDPREIKDSIDEKSRIINELGKLARNPAHWTAMNDDDRKACSKFVWEYFSRPLIQKALEIARKNKKKDCDGFFGRIIAILSRDKDGGVHDLFDVYESGLNNHLANESEWWASQEVDRAIDRILALKLDDRLGVLDSLWAVGSISPLVGLFGTVVGISLAFGKIHGLTNQRLLMSKLAGDINIALSTTIVGLVLGIFAFLLYYIFKSKIEGDGSRIEMYFTKITNLA